MSMHILKFLPFGAFALCMVAFHVWKWDFFSRALSDKNSPSGTRLSGYWVVLTVCFCEVFTTMRTMKFDTEHMKWLSCVGLAYFGVLKITEMFVAWKGGKLPNSDMPQNGANATEEK